MNKLYSALGLVTLIGCGSSTPAGSSGAGGSGEAGLSPGNGASGGSSAVCVAGQQIVCACAGGIQGAQACKADGSGYLACDCTMNGAGGANAGGSAGMSNGGGGAGAGGDAGTSGAGGTGGSSVGGSAGASGSGNGGVGGSAGGGVSGGGTSGGGTAGTGGGGMGGSGGAASVCGNNVIESGETCDDGNKVTEACAYGQTSCTVCNASCKSVAGATSFCGDGTVKAAEACDDGNKTAGDGCSSTCTVETGFACTGTPSACNRSCNGLAKTCGPAGNVDCCASSGVKGTPTSTTPPFYRSYDGATYTDKSYPATVSDFRLDNYEITVGRFRKFVAAYSQSMITQGAGKNPNNPSDTGWDTAWNASLAVDTGALMTAVGCDPAHQTYTAGNDSLPINCLDWFEAEAFCIWDGGRLPTEAEWNYAAAGGRQQRVYPWGSTDPDCTYANYLGANGGYDPCVGTGAANRVGSESPQGDGYYGQADLAGNVEEWVQDWFVSPYPAGTCVNCTDLTASSYKALRGATFISNASYLPSSYRGANTPSLNNSYSGARCARTR